MMTKRRTAYRSSKTGRFIKESHAKRSPSTTEKERIRMGRRSTRRR